MPVKCSICTHERAREIDDLLDAGEYKKNIAAQFKISVHALSRHGRGLCKVETDSLEAQAAKWRQRADALWQRGSVDEDSRAMAQAVSAGLRSVELAARQKERDAEAKPDAETDDRVSIGDLDSLVSLLTEIPPDPVDQAKLKEALQRARAINRPDMVQIFFRALENQRFSEDLATWAATWQPTEKGEHESIPQVTSAPN